MSVRMRPVRDISGQILYFERDFSDQIRGMLFPVRHRSCNGIFDEADVKPLARYAECDVYMCPVCGVQMDNRTWTSHGVERLRR